MKNEISSPNQVMFKKEFYVKHLMHFENLYRMTQDYQRDKTDDLDKHLIEQLKETLEF